MATGPPPPEHPELRSVAEALEMAGISGEIRDAGWRLVFNPPTPPSSGWTSTT